MKILFVAPANSSHTIEWVSFFHQKQNSVRVVSLYSPTLDKNQPGTPKINDLNVSRFSCVNFLFSWLYLVFLLFFFRPNIVHAHTMGRHGLLTALLPKLFGVKMIITPWGSDFFYALATPFKLKIIKFMLSRADGITTDSEKIKKQIKSITTKSIEVKIIQFGFDFSSLEKNIIGAKQKKTDIKRIISLRNHEPVYDNLTLLRSAKILLKRDKSFHFFIAGSGTLTDSYKDYCCKNDISKNVHFLGKLSKAKLLEELSGSDLYVSCSLSDAGIAKSTAESMAVGIPVIISDVAENNQWVIDGKTGYLFGAGDAKQLAKKIEIAITKGNLSSISKAGKLLIYEKNNLAKEMLKMSRIYSAFSSSISKNKRNLESNV